MFNGVKQPYNSDLKSVVLDIVTNKMELEISNQDVIAVKRLNLSKGNSKQDAIAPVVVTFKSKGLASKVFKEKSKLARTGIFVSENLTKRRRDVLNLARDKYGNKQVWSDQAMYLSLVIRFPAVYGLSTILLNSVC